MAADAEALWSGFDAAQADPGAGADPAVLVAVDALEIVPIAQEMLDVAGNAEVDDIVALAGVQLAALGRREQVVDLALERGSITAGGAEQTVGRVALEGRVAVGATEEGFEVFQTGGLNACAAFLADGGQRPAEPAGGTEFGNGRALDEPLAPAALGNEDFVLVLGEVLPDQGVPIGEPHGVVLADTETLFLMRADDVADQIAEQAPIVQAPLPGLHGVVVRAAIEPQRKLAAQRLLGEQKYAAGLQHAVNLAEHGFDIHELAEHLEGADEPQGFIGKGKIRSVSSQADGRTLQMPRIHEHAAVAK